MIVLLKGRKWPPQKNLGFLIRLIVFTVWIPPIEKFKHVIFMVRNPYAG
jgi:hypothetical protein